MAHCPGCGYKLKPWNVKAECPKCGVNIPNYNWEERLEQDAQRSEWAFAKFRRSVKYLKRGLVGTKLSIVRLVFTFVPLVIFVIPAFRLTMNLPFSSFENQYVSLLDIILAIVDGIDIGALFTLMGSEIVGGACTLFLAGFLLIALGVVSAVLNFFVLIICSVKHKYIANYVLCILSALLFVAAIPVFIVSFQQMDAIGLPVFGGSVNAAFFVGIFLFLVNLTLNLVTAKHLEKIDAATPEEPLPEKPAFEPEKKKHRNKQPVSI